MNEGIVNFLNEQKLRYHGVQEPPLSQEAIDYFNTLPDWDWDTPIKSMLIPPPPETMLKIMSLSTGMDLSNLERRLDEQSA